MVSGYNKNSDAMTEIAELLLRAGQSESTSFLLHAVISSNCCLSEPTIANEIHELAICF